MSHNQFPAGWVSPVPAGHAPGLVEYELLWNQLYKAPNFDDGSTHAPGAFITVGGSGFNLTGTGHTLAAAARFSVASTGEIRLEVGGTMRVYGSASVYSGGVLNVRPGGALDVFGGLTLKSTGSGGPGLMSVEAGASITVLSSALINLAGLQNITGSAIVRDGGDLTCEDGGTIVGDTGSILAWEGQALIVGPWAFGNDTWPLLTPVRPWERHTLDIAFCTFNQGAGIGPDLPDAWSAPSPVGDAQCVRTFEGTSGGGRTVFEWRNLPPGATLTAASVRTIGGDPSFSTLPKYTLVRWQTGEDTLEELSADVTDAHDVFNWTTTVLTATITPDPAAPVIDAGWRYGVKMTHPHALSGSDVVVLDCKAVGTAGKIQNT